MSRASWLDMVDPRPAGPARPAAPLSAPGSSPAVEPGRVAPPASAVEPTSAVAPAPPLEMSPDQMQDASYLFERQHGRAPTILEQRMITGTPALRRTLGRMPTRLELLQYTQGRVQAPAPPQQFEVDHGQSAATAPGAAEPAAAEPGRPAAPGPGAAV